MFPDDEIENPGGGDPNQASGTENAGKGGNGQTNAGEGARPGMPFSGEPHPFAGKNPAEQTPSEARHQEGRPPSRSLNEREVKVINVFQYEERADLTFVLLQDGRGRNLPIFIGQAEALAIFIALQKDNRDFHRPLTHDLLKNIVEKLGGKVERLTIDDMWQDTFYARLVINMNGEWVDVDCRPSDGIAVALRAQAPIYVADEVLDTCRLPED